MSRILLLILPLCLCLSCKGGASDPDQPAKGTLAFPGAQGGGAYTEGGRSANVFAVTTLEDAALNPPVGSLRYALQQAGRRIIVFRVAGRIDLKSQLNITNGNVTIMGQSAPGDGICISGYPVVIKADNVILRFLRFRMGDLNGKEGDALTVQEGHKDIIIDHCSMSWSTDECVSTYGVQNFTLQYCFITESLNNSVHAKGAHGYGGIWGGTNASYHHNLLAHHNSRNPRFDHDFVDRTCRGPLDYVNNVVYNWAGNSAYGGESADAVRKINFVANYYKPGPASSKIPSRLLDPTTSCSYCAAIGTVKPAQFYLVGNYMYGSEMVTADNWQGSTVKTAAVKAKDRWTSGLIALTTEQTALEAYETVLQKAGCSLQRDAVDTRIVGEVRNGNYTYRGTTSTNGLIDTPSDVGGWPDYTGTAAEDKDYDDLPDAWEVQNGLDPTDSFDAGLTTLQPPYTNLEVYMNQKVEHLY